MWTADCEGGLSVRKPKPQDTHQFKADRHDSEGTWLQTHALSNFTCGHANDSKYGMIGKYNNNMVSIKVLIEKLIEIEHFQIHNIIILYPNNAAYNETC